MIMMVVIAIPVIANMKKIGGKNIEQNRFSLFIYDPP